MTAPIGRSSIGIRVRPNSLSFIKDLQEDLKTKKATFWVDVRAKTAPASKDVTTWARTTLKNIPAKVDVGANMTQANKTVAAWRLQQSKRTTTINIHSDTTAATANVKAWRQFQENKPVVIKVIADVSQANVDKVRNAVSKQVKVDASARAKATAAKKDITSAVGQGGLFDIEVNAKTGKAEAKIDTFLNSVQGEQIAFDLDIDTAPAVAKAEAAKKVIADPVKVKLELDTKTARLENLNLRNEVLRRKLTINVDAKLSKSAQFEKAIANFEKGIGSGSLIRSLDVGPFSVGKPTGLTGTLTTITLIAGAVPAVVTSVSALSKAFMDLAGAAAIVPGAIGGILASLSTFQLATHGVGDALSAMFDMWNEGATAQASTARRSVQAHGQLRRAVVEEARAQRDVGRARREALGDLRDLNNELRRGVLNEAQAILDVQRARDEYAKGDFENETDRQQRLLNIRSAEQSLIEVRERAIGLQQKANDAREQGVEGSDKVVDALEAQARATDAIATATQAIASAQATGALGKFNDALGLLSPNAREFVLAFRDARGEFQGFKTDIQDLVFEGLGPGMKGLFDNLIPIVKPGMEGIAKAMNQNILAVFDSLKSDKGQNIIERILGGTEQAQNALTKVIDPLIRGVGTLTAAGAEHLPQMVELIGRLTDRFATFIENADENGTLDSFLDRGVQALGYVADIAINIGKAVNNLGKAFEGDLLQKLAQMTDEFQKWLGSTEGQTKLKEFIKEAGELWESWRPVLEDLPDIFEAVSDAARVFIELLTPFLNLFTEIMEDAPWLIQGLVGAWAGAKVLTGFFGPLLGVIKMTKEFIGLVQALPGVAAAISAAASGMPGKKGVAARAGLGVASAAGPALIAGAVTAGVTNALIDTGANAAAAQPNAATIESLNAQLPAGSKPIAGVNKDTTTLAVMHDLAAKGDPALKWVMAAAGPNALGAPGTLGSGLMFMDPAAELELAKRYLWVIKNVKDSAGFVPPTSYASGGYTGWGEQTGHLAVLHGKEYVQPADTTAHYGVGAMRAIHEKRIPKGLLQGFTEGGLNERDPNDPRNINPSAPILPAIIQHGLSGAQSAAGNITNVVSSAQGAFGPAPGPGGAATPGIPGMDLPATPAAGTTPITAGLFGLNFPLGSVESGWPGGTAPVGLGGGADGFDIRNFGIGPGPPGSTPSDWATWGANFGAETVTKFGEALLTGALGFFGMEGLMSNPYVTGGRQLLGHFASAGAKDSSSAQGPGAADTNAQVNDLISTYDNMATNPDYPGVPALPNVTDLATGSAASRGLQRNTEHGKQLIQAAFEWATNIGGVRNDSMKWHPNGLALDVMTDPGHGNNDPPSPEGAARGDALVRWIEAYKKELGVDYYMWREKDHWNHVHVNFAASGYGPGNGPVGQVGPGANTTTSAPSPYASTRPTQDAYMRERWKGMDAAQREAAVKGKRYKPDGTPIVGEPSRPVTPKDLIPTHTRDSGGWIPTGPSIVQNNTGKPEYVIPHDRLRSYAQGGYAQAAIPPRPIPPPRPTPPPRGPDAKHIQPRPTPPPIAAQPQPATPRPMPTAPPVATPPATQAPTGPGQMRIAPSDRPKTGVGPSDTGMHVHPAVEKGITSGAAALGNAAATAMQIGAALLGAAGAGGAAGSFGGSAGASAGAAALGGMSSYVAGLFQQGGKIGVNVANVASSFLVGNITGGTTENPYGVTQRESTPTGGTRVVNASQNQYGDIYTNNLEEYFALKDRKDRQRAQSGLGRWGNA